MKPLFRAAFVQGALAILLAGYLEFVQATTRWRYVNTAAVDAALTSPNGVIGCFWHGRIALAMACRPVLGSKPRRVFISLSRDGDFIAKAVDMMGVPAIRGSAGAKGKVKGKGGANALRQALSFLEEGGCMIITPDGPRGPNQVMQDGVVTMARMSGAPVFMFGLATTSGITLKSWDKGRLPLPFGRGCAVFAEAGYAPREADAATIEALRLDWQNRLTAAQERAEAILAGTGD